MFEIFFEKFKNIFALEKKGDPGMNPG